MCGNGSSRKITKALKFERNKGKSIEQRNNFVFVEILSCFVLFSILFLFCIFRYCTDFREMGFVDTSHKSTVTWIKVQWGGRKILESQLEFCFVCIALLSFPVCACTVRVCAFVYLGTLPFSPRATPYGVLLRIVPIRLSLSPLVQSQPVRCFLSTSWKSFFFFFSFLPHLFTKNGHL